MVERVDDRGRVVCMLMDGGHTYSVKGGSENGDC